MAPTSDADGAELFDFLDEFERDRERGRAHPLAHYLRRYPGHEEALAREYLRLTDEHPEERAPQPEPAAPLPEGERRIGPYRLLRELGSGGQGAVWLAEDTRIARQVALKFMPSSFALLSAERRRRFQREAEVVSRLEHPSICPVYEAQIEHDPPYIAMRAVDGETLAAAIARARAGQRRADDPLPLPPRTPVELRRVLAFFERAARALHAAHEAGVVHRDIKPGNVMVSRAGEPVLLDFGQARDEHAALHERTLSGEVFGTPAYMSPEQIEGSSKGVDRRSDVWSLGASLYEALTLHRPFMGESVAALLHSIGSEPLPNPRGRGGVLGEDIAVVLETALEKDLARRYVSALELAEDLRRIREYEPIRARPASAALKLRRWAQRHPALALAIAAILTGALGTVYLARRERNAAQRESEALRERGVALQREVEALKREDAALVNVLGRYLAVRSAEVLAEDPAAALALGLRAVERAPGYATRSALFAALEQCWLANVLTAPKGQMILDLDLAPDGRRALGALNDGTACAWDLRDGTLLFELRVSERPVEALRVDPLGRSFVTASAEPALGIWRLADGAPLARVEGLGATWSALALLPTDGTLVALARNGRGVIADPRDGSVRSRFELEPERYNRLCAAPDGGVLLASSAQPARPNPLRSEIALVLDARDGRVRARLAGHTDAISDSDVSPDGARAATASQDGTVRLWSLPDGAPLGEPLTHAGPVTCARFANDGEHLVAGFDGPNGSRTLLWDLGSRTARPLDAGQSDRVHSIDVSPRDGAIVVGTRDPALSLWSATGELVHSVSERLRPVSSRWSADGTRIVTHALAPYAHVWWAENRPDIYTLKGHSAAISSVEFSPDGARALTVAEDGSARLWHTPRSPQERGALACGAQLASVGAARRALFAPDGRACVLSSDGNVGWLEPGANSLVRMSNLPAEPRAACFEPGSARLLVVTADGRVCVSDGAAFAELADEASAACWAGPGRIAVGGAGARLRWYDVATRALLREQHWGSEGGLADVLDLAARPDGAEVALSCRDSRLRFFGPHDDAPPRPPKVAFVTRSLAYDSTGAFLLAVGAAGRGVVRVLDLARDKPVSDRVSHTADLTSGAFDRGGGLVLTSSRDRSVYVRETATGEPVARRTDFSSAVTCAAFSRDGGEPRVISGCADGTAHIWPVDPTAAARARAPRDLWPWEEEREKRFAGALPYR